MNCSKDTAFYKRDPSEALTTHTWTRIMDSTVPVHAIVADHAAHGVIGTWIQRSAQPESGSS